MKNMKTFVKTNVEDGSVRVYKEKKTVIVPSELWDKIKSHIDFLSWAELSSMVAHATNGLGIYTKKGRRRG